MTPAEWARVEAALDELLALPQSDRSAGLERIAGDDPSLRRELSSLLARVNASDPLLDRAPFAESGSLAAGTRIGAYRLVSLIGRGGMGEVYRAERADGQYEQQVALKLIRRELADQSARFQSERQTLARLDHPGIARLLDGGVVEDGRPYMVMELVVGSDLVTWCRQHSSSLEERLRLFTAICSALEYAHRNLVVHRDLKPANVVVTAEGTVKVLDFGIAKLLGAPDGEAPTEHAPMTPAYAAPEQLVRGAITTATDVYALGTLLFELLAGVGPWSFRELSLAAGIEKVLREPAPVMSNIACAQRQPPVPPKLLRGDLDAIVAKALRKEPERRYTTVAALREDIERTGRREPVAARGGARLYAVGLFFRRYRLLVASTTLAILALIAGTATTMWQAHTARMEARRADAVRDFLLEIFRHNSTENPDGAHARQTTAEQLLDIGADRIRTGLTTEPMLRGQMMDVLADLYDQLEKFDKVAELERLRLAEIRRVDGDRPSADEAGAQWLLGRALTMQGDYPAAYEMLRTALGTMDAIHEKASARRAEALLETGRLAYHQATPDSLQAANRYAAESFDVYQSADPGNPDKLFALQLEARVAERQGRLSEAERVYRQFVSLSAQFPAIPALSAHGYDDLGSLLLDERRYREAEPQLRRAIEIYSKAEGEKQFDTATDRAYLGELLIATNRGSEGDALLREALSDLEETQGVDNLPTTAVVRLRFARAELRRGNLSLAEELLRRNIAAFEAKNPVDHNYWPETLRTDAELKLSQGRFEEAGAELKRSDALWPVDSPNDGLRHGVNRVLEARLALEQGRYDQSARAALEKVRSTWPATDRELPAVYVLATLALGEAELHQGRGGAGAAAAAELAQRLLERLGVEPEHEALADWEARAHLLLGRALQQEGRGSEARVQLEWAIRLREKFDHPQSPWLAEARVALASCCEGR